MRVSESIISSTCLFWSRKYSATVQATFAARTRSSGASSEVETITTQRFNPSGPRLCSMNSRTSRARSPISATTEMSALVYLAMLDISVDLPTPGPEKMPMRWPRPQVCRPSMARTLVLMGLRMFSRSSGVTPLPSILLDSLNKSGPLLSIGSPKPLRTRPRSCSEHQIRGAALTFSILSPRETPETLDSAIRSVRSLWKPMTSAIELFPPRLVMRQSAPNGSARSVASMVRPLMAATLPVSA